MPSWSSRRSQIKYHKRASSPDELAVQSSYPKRRRVTPTADCKVNTPFIGSPKTGRSIECPGRRFSTEKWIEEVGKDVPMNIDSALAQTEPPFYFKHTDTGDVNDMSPELCSLGSPMQPTSPSRPKSWYQDARDSSEEYRSVIDDLTIENKLLRRKLERYERSYCSHLQHEKLFEVKVHGLRAHKRRELEKTLRAFAASLNAPSPTGRANDNNEYRSSQNSQVRAPLDPHPTPVDSAYASTLASEHTLNRRLELNGPGRETKTSSTKNGQRTLTCIQGAPRSLVATKSPRVSESVKKRSVVKRLEQLFTGKSAASIQPDFPRQQQEVSQSAATGDRRVEEANGPGPAPEGAREARILPNGMDCGIEDAVKQFPHVPDDGSRHPSIGPLATEDDSLHQRPTRPIDLDMHQAQTGANNINYIRHLGLDLPAPHPGLPGNGNGWVYLNLLISMAQLHTLNVTPGFVRKAVIEMSSKFELSSDGQQVRWRGGMDETSSGLHSEEHCLDIADTVRSANSSASPDEMKGSTHPRLRREVSSAMAPSAPDLPYQALFAHVKPLSNRSFPIASDHGIFCDRTGDTMNGLIGLDAVPPTGTTTGQLDLESEGGPMIFYNNAQFCTDLSGDANSNLRGDVQYSRCDQRPIGSYPIDETFSDYMKHTEKGSPLSQLAVAAGDYGSNASLEIMSDFPDIDDLSMDSCPSGPRPLPLEASGLSGIQPEDNFMIDVRVHHAPNSMTEKVPKTEPEFDPSSSLYSRLVSARPMQPKNCGKIVSSTRTDLAPSSLPSPSYICLPFSPSESDASDSDDDMEEDGVSDNFPREMAGWRQTASVRSCL